MASGNYSGFGAVHIDGVNIKIADKLNAPKKVELPKTFKMGNPTEVLFMEYDYQLEERVVQWCTKQKEAVKVRQRAIEEAARIKEEEAARLIEEEAARLREEATARLKEKEELRLKEQEESRRVENEATETNDESENDEKEMTFDANKGSGFENDLKANIEQEDAIPSESPVQHECPSRKSENFEDSSSKSEATASVPNQSLAQIPNVPVLYNTVNGILTPLPANSSQRQISVASNASSAFDPKDFENNEFDPFETVELNTLDDMAELNKVLQGIRPSDKQSTPTSCASAVTNLKQTTTANVNTQGNFAQGKVNIGKNGFAGPVTYNVAGGAQQYSTATVSSSQQVFSTTNPFLNTSNTSSAQTLSSVNYPNVNVGLHYGNNPQSTVSFNKSKDAVTFDQQRYSQDNAFSNSSHQWQDSKMALGYTNQNHLYSGQNGTPFSQCSNFAGAASNPVQSRNGTSNTNMTNMNNSSNVVAGIQSNSSVREAAEQLWSRPDVWPQTQSTSNTDQYFNEFYQKSSPASIGSMALSTSGFEKLKDSSGSKSQSNSRSNTPVSVRSELRNSKSASDLTKLSDAAHSQQEIHQKETTRDRSNTTPPCYDPAAVSKAADTKLSARKNYIPTLPDPYNDLDRETRRYVDRITDMGFQRDQAARAVQKLGKNDKKILDFLWKLNILREKGYPDSEVEDALMLLKNDEKKTLKFLILCRRYEEFGFSKDKIKQGLLKNDLDENITLDWLTSSPS